jgi:hypothetical protein
VLRFGGILYILHLWTDRPDFTAPAIAGNQGETLEEPEMTLAEKN